MQESYPDERVGAPTHRPFVIVEYKRARAGSAQDRADLPDRCPKAVAEERFGECRVVLDHLRERKTGPRHLLVVARCKAHGGFTLYPPAYAPYQRQPIVQTDATPPTQGKRGRPPSADEILARFQDTLFQGALDAAGGRAWARDSDDAVPDRWWSTQTRWLRDAVGVLGLAAELASDVRAQIGGVLGVATLRLRDASRAISGYRSAGAAVCGVLSSLRQRAREAFDLLVCGYLVGRWGLPMTFDAQRGFERSPFRVAGTAGKT